MHLTLFFKYQSRETGLRREERRTAFDCILSVVSFLKRCCSFQKYPASSLFLKQSYTKVNCMKYIQVARPVTRGGRNAPAKNVLSIGQNYWIWFKKVGPLSENSSPPWCPELATGLQAALRNNMLEFTDHFVSATVFASLSTVDVTSW